MTSSFAPPETWLMLSAWSHELVRRTMDQPLRREEYELQRPPTESSRRPTSFLVAPAIRPEKHALRNTRTPGVIAHVAARRRVDCQPHQRQTCRGFDGAENARRSA